MLNERKKGERRRIASRKKSGSEREKADPLSQEKIDNSDKAPTSRQQQISSWGWHLQDLVRAGARLERGAEKSMGNTKVFAMWGEESN